MENEPFRMKPMLILEPGIMSEDHQKILRENGICVVEAQNPEKIKLIDPLPEVSSRTQIENAAIKLSRILLNKIWGNYTTSGTVDHSDIVRIYVDMLLAGSPLDKRPSREQQEQEIYSAAKADELRRLAREEAKAEREAAKAAKKGESKP